MRLAVGSHSATDGKPDLPFQRRPGSLKKDRAGVPRDGLTGVKGEMTAAGLKSETTALKSAFKGRNEPVLRQDGQPEEDCMILFSRIDNGFSAIRPKRRRGNPDASFRGAAADTV